MNINCKGGRLYKNTTKYLKSIDIKLRDNHYTLALDDEKVKALQKFYTFKERNIVMFQVLEGGKYKIYDGSKILVTSKDKFEERKKANRESEIYIQTSKEVQYKWVDDGEHLCKREKIMIEKDIKTQYDEYVKNAKTLLEESKGDINLFKGEYVPVTKELFTRKATQLKETEKIEAYEAQFLQFMGGLMYSKPGYYKNIYQYDINSFYMYCLLMIKCPIKQGNTIMLKELPETLELGIYSVKIYESNDEDIDKLFRFNPKNKYTNFDIELARFLSLKVELLIDKQHLIYPIETRIEGRYLFGKFVELMYELKRKLGKEIPIVKTLGTSLWGALCEKDRKYACSKEGVFAPEGFNYDEADILEIRPKGSEHEFIYVEDKNIYKTDYARIGPFLTSFARKKFAEMVYPHREHIVRIHTDGFISTKNLDNEFVKLNEKGEKYSLINQRLGGLKKEYIGDEVEIINVNKMIWFKRTLTPHQQ